MIGVHLGYGSLGTWTSSVANEFCVAWAVGWDYDAGVTNPTGDCGCSIVDFQVTVNIREDSKP